MKLLDQSADLFRAAVASLVDQRCWGVSAGHGTGSRFVLHLGTKIDRDKMLTNSFLPQAIRQFEGEYSLFVEGCPWRVQSSAAVIGGWLDDNANDGPMVATLERLAGALVQAATIESPAWDLKLFFDNDLILCVFPDATNATDQDDNYSIFTPESTFIVSSMSQLRREPGRLSG